MKKNFSVQLIGTFFGLLLIGACSQNSICNNEVVLTGSLFGATTFNSSGSNNLVLKAWTTATTTKFRVEQIKSGADSLNYEMNIIGTTVGQYSITANTPGYFNLAVWKSNSYYNVYDRIDGTISITDYGNAIGENIVGSFSGRLKSVYHPDDTIQVNCQFCIPRLQ